jgi:hypothetical protein
MTPYSYNCSGAPSTVQLYEAAPDPTGVDVPERIIAAENIRGHEYRCVVSTTTSEMYDAVTDSIGGVDLRYIARYPGTDIAAIARWRHFTQQIWGCGHDR